MTARPSSSWRGQWGTAPIPDLPGQGLLFAVPSDPRPSSMTQQEGWELDRIAQGHPLPGHPSTCAGCDHGKVHHSHTNRRKPCERPECPCTSFAPRITGGDHV